MWTISYYWNGRNQTERFTRFADAEIRFNSLSDLGYKPSLHSGDDDEED